MADKTYKNAFDDGYTTYHDDGSKSTTYKNVFDDGTTTYNSDGSKSTTYKNVFDDGYTTYNSDGSKSTTYKNVFDDGYTTYNSDGSKSSTYKNVFDDGYTTYTTGGYTGGAPGAYGNTGNGYGGAYTGLYFGGGATPYRHNLSFFDYVLIAAGIAAMGAALWWRSITFPYLLLGIFAATVIASLIHAKGGDLDKQEMWTGFTSLIAVTLTMYLIHFPGNEPAEILRQIAFWIMPALFMAAWVFVIHIADDPDGEGLFFFLGILLFVSWFTVSYAGLSSYQNLFCVINDVIFIILYLTAALFALLSLTGKNKIIALMFPVTCFCLFMLERTLTGFQGIWIIKDYIFSLF